MRVENGGVIVRRGKDGSLTFVLAATKRLSPQVCVVSAEYVEDLLAALREILESTTSRNNLPPVGVTLIQIDGVQHAEFPR